MIENELFNNPTIGQLTYLQLINKVAEFMDEDTQAIYHLVIGTDSRQKKNNGHFSLELVTAVVIHRRGSGGRYFWKRITDAHKNNQILRNKIYKETILSLELAKDFVPKLRQQINGQKYSLEIHIDVGETGPTRDMIKEVVGIVTGSGYTAKTKPEGYGAFVVADRHT
jgi:hypothetical protein